ncbi:DUF2125 domain-containing protein [Gluconacetobacter sacchari]|uniref:DUF2125 domain-containing protein n=1 Tax=Gluconacetobacter sacchari TaxID=92759 RepID=UPI0039B6AB3A
MLAMLALALLDGAAWQAAQRTLDHMAARWSAQLRREGWTVRPGTPARGGSPLTARLTLQDPRLEGPAAGRTVAWGARTVALSLSLLHPLTLRIGLEGPQAARLAGPGPLLALRAQGDGLRFGLPLGLSHGLSPDAMAGHATWAARSLALQVLAADGRTTDLRLHDLAGRLLWNGRAGPDASRLALTARAAMLDLPPTWPLPPTPAEAHRLSDTGLTLSLPGGGGSTLLVQDLHARWMHLSLAVAGRARLPATGGANGTFTLTVAGIGRTVRTLDQAGALSPDWARAVTAIDRLARGSPGDAAPDAPPPTDRRLSLPLRLQGGTLFLGAMALGHMADLLP